MYLDSSVLVKLFVREADSSFYAERANAHPQAWSSQLTLTECWSAFCRKNREGEIDAETMRQAWSRLEAVVQEHSLQLQPVSVAVLRLANRMIEQCQRQTAIRTLDAIHLASCELRGAYPLMTADNVMRKAASVLGMPLIPLPK